MVGRQSVELKICSCPGRDKNEDEAKYDPITKKKQRKTRHPSNTSTVAATPTKQPRLDTRETPQKNLNNGSIDLKNGETSGIRAANPDGNNEEEIFTLRIRGRKMFELMSDVYKKFEDAEKYQRMMGEATQGPTTEAPKEEK